MELTVAVLVCCLFISLAVRVGVAGSLASLGNAKMRAVVSGPIMQIQTNDTAGMIVRDTTNPHKDWVGDPSREVNVTEGIKPIHVAIAMDEEYLATWGFMPGLVYAIGTMERADEALAYHYGIDLRYIAVFSWDSDDSLTRMGDLFGEAQRELTYVFGLLSENGQHAEIILALTEQECPDDYPYVVYGIAPYFAVLGFSAVTLCNPSAYWVDDNVVQHEVSHLLCNLDDHPDEQDTQCCMAYYKELIYGWIWEDGWLYGPYNSEFPRIFLLYDYCARCDGFLQYVQSGHGIGGNPLKPLALLSEGGEIGA
jgi:hypothetical protein